MASTLLAEMGIECDVVAPTLIPVKAGDRVKTDRSNQSAWSTSRINFVRCALCRLFGEALAFQNLVRFPTSQELLDFEGGTWEFKVLGRDVKITRSPALPQKDDEQNRRLMLWFHRLTEQKLLPLHASHPIKCVTFVRY